MYRGLETLVRRSAKVKRATDARRNAVARAARGAQAQGEQARYALADGVQGWDIDGPEVRRLRRSGEPGRRSVPLTRSWAPTGAFILSASARCPVRAPRTNDSLHGSVRVV